MTEADLLSDIDPVLLRRRESNANEATFATRVYLAGMSDYRPRRRDWIAWTLMSACLRIASRPYRDMISASVWRGLDDFAREGAEGA